MKVLRVMGVDLVRGLEVQRAHGEGLELEQVFCVVQMSMF